MSLEKPPAALSKSDLVKILVRAGLKPHEALLYVTLHPLKVATVTRIAKAAGLERSNAYTTLRSLVRKGLVAEFERGKIIHFVVESPSKLQSFLEEREHEFADSLSRARQAIPFLSRLTAPLSGTPRVTMLRGPQGMRQLYRDALMSNFIAAMNAEPMYKMFGGPIARKLFGSDVILRGCDLLVDNPAGRTFLKDHPRTARYEARLLPPGMTFATDVLVYGDTVAFFTYDDDRTVVRIEHDLLAETVRQWLTWMKTSSARFLP
jgi:predicted DNA-binding transcriptional regulator